MSSRPASTQIGELDGALHAFHTIAAERALERADALDAARARGEPLGPLHGVPIALKDNLSTRGITTTASSRILEGFVPPYDATVVAAARSGGRHHHRQDQPRRVRHGLVDGELGVRADAQSVGSRPHARRIERRIGRRPLPRGWRPAALGSDTGGSIRQPAALSGVVGLKPTYGRVSRYGLLAFASSLDQIGPLTRTARDAALILEVIAGADPHDATAAPRPCRRMRDALTGDIRGLRIGVPRHVLAEGVDPAIQQAFDAALEVLRERGATLIDIELPHARYAIPIYYLIATAEASSNLARYDGVRYGLRAAAQQGRHAADDVRPHARPGFGAEVKRRIMLGTYVLSAGYYDAYYLKAQQVRTLLRRDYDQAFDRVDVVAMPTTPDAGVSARREDRRIRCRCTWPTCSP